MRRPSSCREVQWAAGQAQDKTIQQNAEHTAALEQSARQEVEEERTAETEVQC